MLNKHTNTSESSNFPILGTFEGECADSTITNENGLDITREVWENVFNSDIYHKGIDLGHFIGYLGHPEDPGCQDFRNACIVMTEGHIEDDGKVYGKFNLVDTPVGRIVKSFIDAGVTFGISVRGAGDIIHNSVDPETFIFRGFDLVTFPAYPEAIPEFKAIAASTDSESRAKYQKICASVKTELNEITSAEALEVLQEQFPEQSEMYQDIETRKSSLEAVNDSLEGEIEVTDRDRIQLLQEQVNGLTELYLQTKRELDAALNATEELTSSYESEKILMSRKLHVVQRICTAQERDVKELDALYASEHSKLKNEHAVAIKANKRLKRQLESEKDGREEDAADLARITASLDLEVTQLKDQLKDTESKLQHEKDANLQYRTKIEASDATIADRDQTIRGLREELDKTVVEANTAVSRASNLDGKVKDLLSEVEASQELVAEYQDAYATLYSHAVGVDLRNVSVTASTNVEELQGIINGTSSNFAMSDVFVEPQPIDLYDEADDDLVTI